MRKINKKAMVLAAVLFFSQDIYAYLDPGTGSYIFQIIIAVLVSALFSIKLLWRQIRDFFKRKK